MGYNEDVSDDEPLTTKRINGKERSGGCIRAERREVALHKNLNCTRLATATLTALFYGILASPAYASPVVVMPVSYSTTMAHGSRASLEETPANAFFTARCTPEFAYKNERDLIIGSCHKSSFWSFDLICETFEEMAQKRGCTLTGISFDYYGDTAIVYCRRFTGEKTR